MYLKMRTDAIDVKALWPEVDRGMSNLPPQIDTDPTLRENVHSLNASDNLKIQQTVAKHYKLPKILIFSTKLNIFRIVVSDNKFLVPYSRFLAFITYEIIYNAFAKFFKFS